jgi:hypothetical protein
MRSRFVHFRPVRLARLSRPLAVLLVLAIGLAGCGSARHPTAATADNNGSYVTAGHVTYQLQVSRELNQYATEDSQYLTGLPSGTGPPNAGQIWYGVFLWAKNHSQQSRMTASNFTIVDTQDDTYYPVKLNPSANPYAWSPRLLGPLETEPGPDSTASFGPTQGSLLLFKLNNSAYNNRPLTLNIYTPGQSRPSTISLDL